MGEENRGESRVAYLGFDRRLVAGSEADGGGGGGGDDDERQKEGCDGRMEWKRAEAADVGVNSAAG
jgi:hypothetical protein